MYPTLYVQKTAMGEIPYNTWGLTITLAFLFASLVAHFRAARVGIDPDRLVVAYLLAMVFGLAGARLMHFTMATPEVFWRDPLVFFRIWQGGFAFYGGFILAAVVLVAYSALIRLPIWKMVDVLAPSVMLGLSVGRIGCFFAGCCHGKEVPLPADATPLLPDSFSGGQLWLSSKAPFLFELTRHGVGHNDVVLLPTQLYEMVAAFVLFLLASWVWRHRRFDGQVLATVLVLYALWRPFNESLRGDEVRGVGWLGSLTSSQLVSIPMGLLGVIIALVQFRKGVAPEAAFVPDVQQAETGSAPRL